VQHNSLNSVVIPIQARGAVAEQASVDSQCTQAYGGVMLCKPEDKKLFVVDSAVIGNQSNFHRAGVT